MLWMPEKIHIGVINVVRSINKIDIPSIPSWKLIKPEIQFFFSTNWKSGIVESKEYQRKRDRKKFTTEEKIATDFAFFSTVFWVPCVTKTKKAPIKVINIFAERIGKFF